MLVDAERKLCPICQKREAEQRHHVFPQTKMNRKTYGYLLDEPFNIILVCCDCHAGHAEMVGRVEGEMWFREQAVKRGYVLPPASKTLQTKAKFGGLL